MTSVTRGGNYVIVAAGISQVAIPAYAAGAVIINPLSAADQGLAVAEPLYVNQTGPAVIGSSTTKVLYPGESCVPSEPSSIPVYVTSATRGHKFTSLIFNIA